MPTRRDSGRDTATGIDGISIPNYQPQTQRLTDPNGTTLIVTVTDKGLQFTTRTHPIKGDVLEELSNPKSDLLVNTRTQLGNAKLWLLKKGEIAKFTPENIEITYRHKGEETKVSAVGIKTLGASFNDPNKSISARNKALLVATSGKPSSEINRGIVAGMLTLLARLGIEAPATSR